MSELGSGNGTSYPTSIDNDNVQEVNSPNASKTRARAETINDLAAAIIAIETELGAAPKGSSANVKTFLQTQHNLDGSHKSISTNTLSATGQITSTVALGTAPFVVASYTKVANLNASFVEGYAPSIIATPNTIVARDGSGGFSAGTIVATLTGNVTGDVVGNVTGIAATSSRLTDGTNYIHTKIIDIGDWNMDATPSIVVVHGLTFANIRSASIFIRNDGNSVRVPIDIRSASDTESGWFVIEPTTITLTRIADGLFDGSNDYDNTSYNRGWITLTYVA